MKRRILALAGLTGLVSGLVVTAVIVVGSRDESTLAPPPSMPTKDSEKGDRTASDVTVEKKSETPEDVPRAEIPKDADGPANRDPESFGKHATRKGSEFRERIPREKGIDSTGETRTAVEETSDVESAWNRIRERLRPANIAYNTPERMRLGESVAVELELSPSMSVEALKARIDEPGKTEGARILVSEYMVASLTGDDGLTVTRTVGSDHPQEIDRDGINTWE